MNRTPYDSLPVAAGAIDLGALKQPASPPSTPSADGSSSQSAAGGGLSPVVNVTEHTFRPEVVERSAQVPVVVFLGSASSSGSEAVKAALSKIVQEDHGQWVLAIIEIDKNPQLAQAFDVRVIPTLVAIAAGQPLAELQGSQSEPDLRKWTQAILGATEGKLQGAPAVDPIPEEPESDPRIESAIRLVNEGDIAGAIAELDAVLVENPSSAEASAARASFVLMQRAQDAGDDAIDRADASPEDVALQLAAADVEILGVGAEVAFARLIALVRRTGGEDRERVKRRLLDLFDLVGSGDPAVSVARGQLASALF